MITALRERSALSRFNWAVPVASAEPRSMVAAPMLPSRVTAALSAMLRSPVKVLLSPRRVWSELALMVPLALTN